MHDFLASFDMDVFACLYMVLLLLVTWFSRLWQWFSTFPFHFLDSHDVMGFISHFLSLEVLDGFEN